MTRYKVVLVPFPFDDLSSSSEPEFALTGLRISSTLQLHRLMTATTTLIRRELGQLSPSLQAQVNSCLRKLFGLE